jgi:hypothetical protein
MRWSVTAVIAASVALVAAAPASAGVLTTPNVCHYSVYPGFYFAQGIDLGGTATPNPLAPGSGVSLTAASAHAQLPSWVTEYATNIGIFKPGDNQITAKVWIALAGQGTPQGVQVVQVDTVAHTTVTTNPDGSFASATPLDVTIPLPDTAWTAPGAGAAAWRQADAATLPAVPIGPGGSNYTPKGSVVISAKFDGGLGTIIDCLPGTEVEGRRTYTAGAPGAFETASVQAGAPTITPPAVKPPVLTLRTTKLKRSGRRVSISIACADAPCKGTVSMTKATKKLAYSLAAGTSKTLKFTLSRATVKALKKKSRLVTVRVTNEGGQTVSKKLRLK